MSQEKVQGSHKVRGSEICCVSTSLTVSLSPEYQYRTVPVVDDYNRSLVERELFINTFSGNL